MIKHTSTVKDLPSTWNSCFPSFEMSTVRSGQILYDVIVFVISNIALVTPSGAGPEYKFQTFFLCSFKLYIYCLLFNL
jgi:hypothetical protein